MREDIMVTLDTLRHEKRSEILRLVEVHGGGNIRAFGRALGLNGSAQGPNQWQKLNPEFLNDARQPKDEVRLSFTSAG
jgi:hypothetical protein